MKEFYKNFFLNMNEDDQNAKSYDNIIKVLEEMQNRRGDPQKNSFHSNSENDFDAKILEYDKFENPFLYKRNFHNGNLNQLFVTSDGDSQPFFSTDTQLEFLGSLRIWQVAAILIAFIMLMGKPLEFLYFLTFNYYFDSTGDIFVPQIKQSIHTLFALSPGSQQ